MSAIYNLPMPEGSPRRLAAGWLLLAIASLIIAGFFSILLVLSRTPYIQDFFPWVDFFHTALVVHVDLSVLIWFLAFSGVFWSINSTSQLIGLGWFSIGLSSLGTAIVAVSPFTGEGKPLMNNYVPVLQNPVFFIGLAIFGLGFVIMHVRSLLASPPFGKPMGEIGALRFGMYVAAIVSLISVISFIWSYLAIPDSIEGTLYYELLFWGGGHILQFTHTILMLVAWLWLSGASGIKLRLSSSVVILLFGYNLVVALITPLIFLSYDINSYDFRQSFTLLMKYGPGIPAFLIGLVVFFSMFSDKKNMQSDAKAYRAAVISSIFLFGMGGIIGFLIHGINVTIPAHYHGNIVGVTLAFMGLTYYLMPHFGFSKPSVRLTKIQPPLYGMGMVFFIFGLAWAGGHGVERKTAGAAQDLNNIKEIASMGLVGIGGLIAVIGGVLFLIITVRSIWSARKKAV